MGLFTRTAARALDGAASAAHTAGKAVAGQTGGRAADTVVTATLGPIRDRIDVPCTCGQADCTDRA
ncbi:hypothetical protein ACIQGZ_02650 [Streptomyces sp. NPDC092296]|uniref:hypothetical protein n=1 Tax=Streptomyces sp. NPDC092296 TaxID=3366012 RepID=UPI0038121EE2